MGPEAEQLPDAVEHFFSCPACGAEISMFFDGDQAQHSFVEDCEVCCRPIEVVCTVADDTVIHFDARPAH